MEKPAIINMKLVKILKNWVDLIKMTKNSLNFTAKTKNTTNHNKKHFKPPKSPRFTKKLVYRQHALEKRTLCRHLAAALQLAAPKAVHEVPHRVPAAQAPRRRGPERRKVFHLLFADLLAEPLGEWEQPLELAELVEAAQPAKHQLLVEGLDERVFFVDLERVFPAAELFVPRLLVVSYIWIWL